MTTLAQIADRAQEILDDTAAATWSQAEIENWCLDAIRDYSKYFPRIQENTVTIVAGTQKYDLDGLFKAMVQVEYPDAEDPPEYLTRKDHTEPGFWDYEGFYDIVDWGDETNPPEIWISENPSAGGTLRYWMQTEHDYKMGSTGSITVPVRHEPILIQYVIWQAWKELTSTEMQAPTSNSSLLMGQLQQNESGAASKYYRMINQARDVNADEAGFAIWTMDKYETIY